MSRYNGNNGSTSSNDNYDGDDTTLKLQKYAALSVTPTTLSTHGHDQYGMSLIAGFDGGEVIDGIVFQRDDKQDTWKVFSAGKFFNLNPEDGLVYENFDEEDGYTGEMSAQDILDHPRVAGFSETFGGEDYFYTPVGVIVEEAGDIATNDDLDVGTTDNPSIEIGESVMMLSNKSWVRIFAKLLTETGDGVIADNDELEDNPKYDDHEWLTTEDPTLRDELEGRELELWITEETIENDDGEDTTYTVPNLMDVTTGEFVQVDNALGEGDDATESEAEVEAAADGGTVSESSSDSTDTDSTESPDEPAMDSDDKGGLPENVPEALDDLIDYMARNGETTAEEMREFAEDEVENADNIDWEAAANEANQRAE